MGTNATVDFPTDAASMAMFDPQIAAAEADALMMDHWEFGRSVAPVVAGRMLRVGLGGDGVFRLRVTDGDLTPDERDYAIYKVENLGLEVISGKVLVSGYWFDDDQSLRIPVQNGIYTVDLYEIAYDRSSKWLIEGDQYDRENAPADIVALLRSRSGPIANLVEEPVLDSLRAWEPPHGPPFLFESTTRELLPRYEP